MKKIILSGILLLLSSIAYAVPVTLGDITGNALHTEMDTMEQVFRLTDTADAQNDATAFLFLENAGFAGVNSFGIIGSDLTTLEIFSGGSSPLTSATLAWDTATNTVTNLSTTVSAIIDDQLFAFYLASGDGNTYYSVDALNPNDVDMMLSFNTGSSGHSDLLGSDYVLAFEDVYGGDGDYNDMVIGVSDIAVAGSPSQFNQVSEAGALSMMLLGLVSLAVARRK